MTATLDKAILWVLNLSDGRHTLLEMSERSGVDAAELRAAVEILEAKALIIRDGSGPQPGPDLLGGSHESVGTRN